MIALSTLVAFVPAALALNITPGADMMFCLGQGLKSGPRPALAASLGVAAGGMTSSSALLWGYLEGGGSAHFDRARTALKQGTEDPRAKAAAAQLALAEGRAEEAEGLARAAIDAAEHPALYCVDGIASIGCIPFEMNRWGVDLALTASQKGLMSPPGMAFVAASERAWEARLTADMRTAYWEWDGRLGEMHYQKYCGTPPVQSLYGLRRALDMLLEEEGLEAVWRRHRLLAEATRGAISTWAEQGGVDFYVPAPSERSDTVTTLVAPDGCDANALRDFASEKCGVTFGYPVGGFIPSERGFRIAHMGHFNAPMALGSLGALEVAMAALGWPGASGGVSTAAAMLGSALAQE